MSDVKMVEGGMDRRAKDLWELRDKYAALLARHNALLDTANRNAKEGDRCRQELKALREVLAWERECDEWGEWLNIKWWDADEIDSHEIWDIYECARAEVDRLLEDK